MPLIPIYPQDTIKDTVKFRFTSELFSIPDLKPIYAQVPGSINPCYEQLKPILEERIDSLFPPSRVRALKESDYALLAARCWPHAAPDRLTVLAFFMLWLFTWDDHINDFNGYLYKDAVGARQYCEQTIEFTRHALGLPVKESKNGPRKCSSLLDILVCSFDVVGEAIQAVYTSEQSEVFAKELELYVHSVGREHEVGLSGHMPSQAEFWELRMGSSAVRVVLSLNEYSCKTRVSQSIMDHPKMRTLWDEAVVNITIANDILSLKKDIQKGEIQNNLIAIKVNEHDILVQDAISRAKEDLLLSIKRFGHALEALRKDKTFDPALEANLGLRSIIEECQHIMSANVDWSYTTPRYGLEGLRRDSEGWMHIEI